MPSNVAPLCGYIACMALTPYFLTPDEAQIPPQYEQLNAGMLDAFGHHRVAVTGSSNAMYDALNLWIRQGDSPWPAVHFSPNSREVLAGHQHGTAHGYAAAELDLERTQRLVNVLRFMAEDMQSADNERTQGLEIPRDSCGLTPYFLDAAEAQSSAGDTQLRAGIAAVTPPGYRPQLISTYHNSRSFDSQWLCLEGTVFLDAEPRPHTDKMHVARGWICVEIDRERALRLANALTLQSKDFVFADASDDLCSLDLTYA